MNLVGPACQVVIALDVDGTLYNGHDVDRSAIDAVRPASRAGHVILIVTGRPRADLERIIPDVLECCAAAVCEHGTVLVDCIRNGSLALSPSISETMADAMYVLPTESAVIGTSTIGLPISFRDAATRLCASLDGRVTVVLNEDSLPLVPGVTEAIHHLVLTNDPSPYISRQLGSLPAPTARITDRRDRCDPATVVGATS